MDKPKGTISSVDVARLAGVSRSAVSRAFTKGAYVSSETRAKVMHAADALGYRPNAIARGLSKRSTGIVGVVVSDLQNPYYSDLLEKLAIRLQENSYAPLVLVSAPDRMDELIDTLLAYQVDGVLLPASTMSSRMAVECQRARKPVVVLDRYSSHDTVSSVVTDNYSGGQMVAEHLIAKGCRNIAFIGGLTVSSSSDERGRGFRDRLARNGQAPVAEAVGDYTHAGGIVAARAVLSGQLRPDAIFCANDAMAMATLEIAKSEFGLSVPSDLVVVGYDNTAMSSWPLYDLTTVEQSTAVMVDHSIALLLSRIDDPSMPITHEKLQPKLVERGSTRR